MFQPTQWQPPARRRFVPSLVSAGGTLTIPACAANTTSLRLSLSLQAKVYDSTGALVVAMTGTTDASTGVLVLTHASITSGQWYGGYLFNAAGLLYGSFGQLAT